MDKKGMLAALAGGMGMDLKDIDKPGNTGTSQELRTAWAALSVQHTFSPGDLVQWKPGLKNRKFPDYGNPAMFIAYTEPVRCSDEPGDPYFAEKADCTIGVVREGEFLRYVMNSDRLEPYTGK